MKKSLQPLHTQPIPKCSKSKFASLVISLFFTLYYPCFVNGQTKAPKLGLPKLKTNMLSGLKGDPAKSPPTDYGCIHCDTTNKSNINWKWDKGSNTAFLCNTIIPFKFGFNASNLDDNGQFNNIHPLKYRYTFFTYNKENNQED